MDKNQYVTKKKNPNTNLAAEYYVLSMLHRYGIDAHLTLGNKKFIDIIIEKETNKLITIDVKGIKGKTMWALDNFSKRQSNHFIVLVSFLDKINDCNVLPEVYIIPSKDVDTFLYKNPKGNRQGIQLSRMRKEGKKYKNKWNYFQ